MLTTGQSIDDLEQAVFPYGSERLFKSIYNSVDVLLSVSTAYKGKMDARNKHPVTQ
jgi:hypothetical protein